MKEASLMKKIMPWLALLLVLALCPCALAQSWRFEDAGITLTAPAGMVVHNLMADVPLADGETLNFLSLEITDPARPHLLFYYSIFYHPAYAGQHMQDMSGKDRIYALMDYANSIPFGIETFDSNGMCFGFVLDDDANTQNAVAVQNGWFCALTATTMNGQALDDGIVEDMKGILRGVQCSAF